MAVHNSGQGRSKIWTNCKGIFQFLIQCHVASFLFCNELLMVLLYLPFFVPLKSSVYLCAKIFRKDLQHFMKCPSTIFTQEDILVAPKTNLILFFVFDGPLKLELLQTIFQTRVIEKVGPNGKLMYPELQMYWTTFLNYTFWKKDKSFELSNHVRLYDYSDADLILPQTSDETDVQHVCGPLLAKQWKVNRSPWEVLLVQNFRCNYSETSNTKNHSLLILRLHHAMGDGYSLLKLIVRDMMNAPINIKTNFPKFRTWEKIMFGLVLPFKLPWDIAGTIMKTFDGGNAWNFWGKNEKLTRKLWTSISKPLDGRLIKNIKNKYGVSYNDVLYAAAASSCARVMEAAGQIIPKEMSTSIPCPLEGHPDGLVNHFTFDFFQSPMDRSLSREARLRLVSKRLYPSRYYTAPLGFSLINKYCNVVPNVCFTGWRKVPLSLGMSVVAFPENRHHFHGVGINLVDVWANLGPGDGTIGTYMAFMSLNGKQRFMICIDKKYFPDGKLFEKVGEYMEEELNSLWKIEKKTA